MSVKTAFMMGAVGAVAVFAGRALGFGNMILSSPEAPPTVVSVPVVAPKNGYSAVWALIPAAGAWYLSR